MSDRDDKELVFLPLGGTGVIGMNCNLYGMARAANGSGLWSIWASPLPVTLTRH